MRRVAIIADSHFDEHSRFEECIYIHSWIVGECARRGVDLFLHSGDVYERKSTPNERAAVAMFVQSMAAVAPVVIVRGNHDALNDLPLLAQLETQHQVQVVETVGVVVAAGFVIGCLGWPNKANVLTLGAESHEAGELLAGDALRNVLRGLGQKMRSLAAATLSEGLLGERTPRILLAHAMVRGSVVSTGQPLVGCDLELGVEDLRLADADLYALGHIHMPQAWSKRGVASAVGLNEGYTDELADVAYPGSPRRTSYGELEDKHFVIATFDDDGKLCDVEYVKTPSTPMVHLEAGWVDDEAEPGLRFDEDLSVSLAGAEVRLRYSIAPDKRDVGKTEAARLRDYLISKGALVVKVEEVVETTTRARAPELAKATTLADKLDAYWLAKSNTPDGPRRRRLFEKLALLEGGAS